MVLKIKSKSRGLTAIEVALKMIKLLRKIDIKKRVEVKGYIQQYLDRPESF